MDISQFLANSQDGASPRPGDIAEDRILSPYTGWTRAHWVALAQQMLAAARRYGTANHARIHFPGEVGGYGHDVDGLEGFARTFLAAGFLAAGSKGTNLGPLEWYAPGFRYGPDPTLSPSQRWVRPSEHDQAKVEACSLALILHMTREYLWDALDSRTQEMTIEYLAEWIHASYPMNNWVWFRLITEQFLKSVGGPWSREDQEEDLAFNESCYAGDGWYRDGAGRTFDHYGGWVFHVYPLLWCAMIPDDPESIRLRPVFQQRLDQYLCDLVHLIGADGGMLPQGRSLIYRFASAAPVWMGAITGSPAVSPGLVRRAASGLVKNFVTHGAPDEEGILSMGWYGPWRKLAQSYSGPGSPYWACKGLLGLALDEDHPVWTATEEPLPADGEGRGDPDFRQDDNGRRQDDNRGRQDDTQRDGEWVRAMPVPGWIVSCADGIPRVTNHGTDHAVLGSEKADSPLYANLAYSTATFPTLNEDSWVDPLAQSVCLIDSDGRASHRTGFEFLGATVVPCHPDEVRISGRVKGTRSEADSTVISRDPDIRQDDTVNLVRMTTIGMAASRAHAHWVDPYPKQFLHGSGYVGDSTPAGIITVLSVVRGPWEVRSAYVEEASPEAEEMVFGGWALSAANDEDFISVASGTLQMMYEPIPDDADGYAQVRTGGLNSSMSGVGSVGGVIFIQDASPLGISAVPDLSFPVRTGQWVSALITVSRQVSPENSAENTRIVADISSSESGLSARVVWPDGVETRTTLPLGIIKSVPSGTSLEGEKQ